ncbi:MAG: orotate phosphoribosyltransferase [Muribaculum sp.]|nr:orotate phosphoribosyltransferase [Muribaculum sp.]
MKNPNRLLAERLLHISAVKLQPESPFIWASGWNSPIYTDNRRALSYPDVRNFIKVELSRKILEHFPQCDAIAGVATGAIAIAAIVADCLGLPYVYVRSTPKDHGLENMIEGNLKPGSKVVVIEDLIGTGGSSLNAVQAIRMAGCDVVGMTALFNFEFPIAVKRFRDENVPLVSLLDYTTMVEVAGEIHYIEPSDIATLNEWREDPANWVPGGNSGEI